MATFAPLCCPERGLARREAVLGLVPDKKVVEVGEAAVDLAHLTAVDAAALRLGVEAHVAAPEARVRPDEVLPEDARDRRLVVDELGVARGDLGDLARGPRDLLAVTRLDGLEDLLGPLEVLREALVEGPRLGRKRVIQRRFNVSIPRARVPKKDAHVRDRSER